MVMYVPSSNALHNRATFWFMNFTKRNMRNQPREGEFEENTISIGIIAKKHIWRFQNCIVLYHLVFLLVQFVWWKIHNGTIFFQKLCRLLRWISIAVLWTEARRLVRKRPLDSYYIAVVEKTKLNKTFWSQFPMGYICNVLYLWQGWASYFPRCKVSLW